MMKTNVVAATCYFQCCCCNFGASLHTRLLKLGDESNATNSPNSTLYGKYINLITGACANLPFVNFCEAVIGKMSDRDRRRSRRSSSREPPSNSIESRRPPDVAGMTSLKVDNLSYRTSPEDLKPLFEKYGEVGDVYIPRDRFTKESRGFAFVRFYDKRDAEEAMDRLDGYVLDGREVRVQLARYGRPSEPPHVRYGKNYIPPRGK